ncbi:MAG: hypothetical protein FK734_07195 [Asgard group archaeon]|nr:hypothetical protein [Asgard group archaeon]
MNYKRALTREPGLRYDQCLSDHPLKKYINIGDARRQHQYYRNALTELGLEVIVLPRDDNLPDACFVEDTVIVHDKKALVGRMAVESRRGEETAVVEFLKQYLELTITKAPATIEGGDVIHLENKLICGQTQRTNSIGIKQLLDTLNVKIEIFEAPDIMHLKSYVTYLGKNTIITSHHFAEHPLLKDFTKILVPRTESYAANTLTINGVTLVPRNYPKTHQLLKDAGFEIMIIETLEFSKCDGALTCLSVLF